MYFQQPQAHRNNTGWQISLLWTQHRHVWTHTNKHTHRQEQGTDPYNGRSNWLVAPPPYTGQYPLSSMYCTLQCGLQITRLAALSQPRMCDFRMAMPDQRTAGAATQGIWYRLGLKSPKLHFFAISGSSKLHKHSNISHGLNFHRNLIFFKCS